MNNYVRNVLKRFFELRAEVKALMEKDWVPIPALTDPKWLMDLAFLVDITHELNVLNKKLQGQGQLVSAAYDNVRAFSTKLMLWKAQLSQTNLCHFPACKAVVDAGTPHHFFLKKHLMRPNLTQTLPAVAPR